MEGESLRPNGVFVGRVGECSVDIKQGKTNTSERPETLYSATKLFDVFEVSIPSLS